MQIKNFFKFTLCLASSGLGCCVQAQVDPCAALRNAWSAERSESSLEAWNKCLAKLEAVQARKEAVDSKRRTKRSKEGVRIGMTESEALESSWGRPNSIHRTTTSGGTSEQWVYGGGNYLYFKNGRLTAIQN